MGHWFESPFALLATPIGKLPRDVKPDLFNNISTEMALAHNMFLCMLNAILMQAAYVKPEDQHDFLGYTLCLFAAIKDHHEGEEEMFFPAVEQMSGKTGIMEKNVSQHHAFHDSMGQIEEYVNDCLTGTDKYNGNKLVSLIEVFGPVLHEHPADEIETLEDLRSYSADRMKSLPDVFKAMVQHENIMALASGWVLFRHENSGVIDTVPAMFNALDRTYEDGLWENFPPMPFPLKWVIQNVFMQWNSAWWKFAPCTPQGQPKPHPYAQHQTVD